MIARRSAASRVPFGGSAALDAASAPCVASALTDGQPAGVPALSCGGVAARGWGFVDAESHAGPSRRGVSGNRGCEASRFGESRIDAGRRTGDAASTRTDPRTTATAVVSRRTLADAVSDSRRMHGCQTVARGAPLHGAWRSRRPPMNRAIPPPSYTGSSETISRPSAPRPRRCGMATGFRSLSSKRVDRFLAGQKPWRRVSCGPTVGFLWHLAPWYHAWRPSLFSVSLGTRLCFRNMRWRRGDL